MADFVTLSCPSCVGKLQITNDLDRFACGYCGLEHVVRRGGGVVSLSPVVEGLKRVQVGVDKTASELAIPRLQAEIADLEFAINDMENRYFRTYRLQERPKRISHEEAILMMKTDLARLSSGFGARLVKETG